MISKSQLRAIRKNYARRAQIKDRETILSTIFNIPSGIFILIIMFMYLYATTRFFLFFFATIILGLIEVKLIYDAFNREGKRISKGYF
jgi:DMSO reductase anchor subunit